MNITVIGSGNMGGALLRGWYRATQAGIADLHLTATAHTQQTLDRLKAACPQIATTLSNTEAVHKADIVVVAVKPWLLAGVLEEITPMLCTSVHHPTLVSVVAGVTSAELQEMVGDAVPCVYVMPNIAAEFSQSMTFVEETSCQEATQLAARLFEHVGRTMVVPTRLMSPGMMMAGCGIAYVMRYLRAMMEGGVEMGFYPADALTVAMQTMQGAVTLLEQTGLHPEAAIDKVTTPGGITIKGLNELDHAAFNSSVIRALKAGLR